MFALLLFVAMQARPRVVVDPAWQGRLAEIRAVLRAQWPAERLEQSSAIAIEETVDVAGEGSPQALVGLGTGGAYTQEVTVMRLQDGKAVLALFEDSSGKIDPMLFVEGSSAMHAVMVELQAKNHAVIAKHFSYATEGNPGECGAEAYRWNPQTNYFAYDAALSAESAAQSCPPPPMPTR